MHWLKRLIDRLLAEPKPTDEQLTTHRMRKSISAYDHGVLRNTKGEVVAEMDFEKPHNNAWAALRDLEKSRKR